MNSRYPDATPEEVEREGVCIICREEMRAWTEGGAAGEGGRAAGTQDQRSRPKKLPCGHVLHFACLRSWLERQQRCPTCRRPVLDEPLNGPGAQNAAARAQANAAGGAGLAFGAQLGPLGFDIGVGGPGFVQNLMDRMNQQQQRPQPQQNQQNQQNQQQQNQQHNQQAQLQAQLQAQIQAHAQNQGLADVGAGGAGYTDLAQQILRTRQLLDREVAMLEMTQQQLRQLRELQAQAAGIPGAGGLQGQQVPATPLAPGATPPAAATNPYLNTGNNLETNLPPRIRTPGMSVYHGGPVLNGSSATAVLPQGMVLPPGWNVVPLTAPRSTATALPITTPGGTMSLRGAESLRSRRGQQMYRERMMDHHARLTPGEEQTSRSSRPALTRATTAPSGLSRPQQNWAAQRTSGPVTGGNLSERLSQEQMERLSPTVQRSVATISRLLQWQLESGSGITVHETLAGLPDETREEILQGWPNRDMAQELAEGARNATRSEPGADMVRSVANIARWLEILPREERIQVVLGFPEGDFRGFIMMHHPGLRAEVTRLSTLLRDINEEITETPTTISPSGVSGMIESISDWTQISPLDETSSREDIERVERETRETVNRRIQVLNDIARIMRNAAGQLEQVSGRRLPSASSAPVNSIDLSRLPTQFNTENQLSLFGERSIFNPSAQEQALNALEQEVVQEEREWRSKQGVAAVESLLGVAEGPTDEKGKGKAKQEVELNDAQEGEASVTPEAQGKAPVKVTVEDADDE
jgi:E3 ubiquitin-protein ligase synoviolin